MPSPCGRRGDTTPWPPVSDRHTRTNTSASIGCRVPKGAATRAVPTLNTPRGATRPTAHAVCHRHPPVGPSPQATRPAHPSTTRAPRQRTTGRHPRRCRPHRPRHCRRRRRRSGPAAGSARRPSIRRPARAAGHRGRPPRPRAGGNPGSHLTTRTNQQTVAMTHASHGNGPTSSTTTGRKAVVSATPWLPTGRTNACRHEHP